MADPDKVANKAGLLDVMESSFNLPRKRKMKRLRPCQVGKLSRIHNTSLNVSLNSTIIRTRKNNRNLARALEAVRTDLKNCQAEKVEALREAHSLRQRVQQLERVCGLKDGDIEDEVNARIQERMSVVKERALGASRGLQDLVLTIGNILALCSGSSRGSSVGPTLPGRAAHDSRSRSPRPLPRRSVFGIPVVSDDNRDSSPRAARPIRSALVLTKPSAAGAGAVPPAAPSTSAQHEPVVAPVPASLVRPTDFFDGDLSMIAEQSHLDDLDLDSVGVGGAARRSSRKSRKTKSLSRRSTVHTSRSIELFRAGLTEEAPSPAAGAPQATSGARDDARCRETDPGPESSVLPKDEAEARTSSVSAEHKHEDEVPKSETKRSRSTRRGESASARAVRSKSRARGKAAEEQQQQQAAARAASPGERTRRGAGRMSRRDSYEQTKTQANSTPAKGADDSDGKTEDVASEPADEGKTEKESFQQTATRRKSKRLAEKPEVETTKEDVRVEKELESAEGETEPRRKSRRLVRKEPDRNADSEPSNSRVETDASLSVAQETSATSAVEDTREASAAAQDKQSEPDPGASGFDFAVDGFEPPRLDDETKKAKRKSRRAIKAVFTLKDVFPGETDDSKTTSVEKASEQRANNVPTPNEVEMDRTKNVQKNTQSKREGAKEISKAQDKDRRGTFVVEKMPEIGGANKSGVNASKDDGEAKAKRRTFVVPTAPPPAPRPKKTVTNIPILEGKCKAPAQTKAADKERRGTYFVPNPVNRYLDVENLKDITADGLLDSLEDDSSAASFNESGEQATKAQKTSGPPPKAAAAPVAVTGTRADPNSTLYGPDDMELTECLGKRMGPFSVPNPPDFLKVVSPGPLRRPPTSRPEAQKTQEKSRAKKGLESDTRSKEEEEDAGAKARPQPQDAGAKARPQPKDAGAEAQPQSQDVRAEARRQPGQVSQPAEKITAETETATEAKPGVSQRRRTKSNKFKLLKTGGEVLGPSDGESDDAGKAAPSESEASDAEPPVEVATSRRSRRSTKPVQYVEPADSDAETEETPGAGESEAPLKDLLKAKAKKKFQAWQTKPGDIKFTGGKRDISAQMIEDLTRHRRSKSRDRSTVVPKPRARSRSRSRPRAAAPAGSEQPQGTSAGDDGTKSEFDFTGSPACGPAEGAATEKSGGRGRMSYSEFRGRTPAARKKSMEGDGEEADSANSTESSPATASNTVANSAALAPLEPKKTAHPEEEELTLHNHGIMTLLGNGRRTKPRTKGKKLKSVCMAPEKSEMHLITPMVEKTQSMPRTPSPSGSANIVLIKSPPPPARRADGAARRAAPPQGSGRTSPPMPQLSREPLQPPESRVETVSATSNESWATAPEVSLAEPCAQDAAQPKPSQAAHAEKQRQKPPNEPQQRAIQQKRDSSSCTSSKLSQSNMSSEGFGFFNEAMESSVFQSKSSTSESDSPLFKVKAKKKTPSLPRKSLMERKPKDNGEASPPPKTARKSKAKAIRQLESKDSSLVQPKSAKSSRMDKSQSKARLDSTEKENESFATGSSQSDHQSAGQTASPSRRRAAKTPKTAAKSAKGKSAKSAKKTATKTPGTTKKATDVTLSHVKRRLQALKSKSSQSAAAATSDSDSSPVAQTAKRATGRRLYSDPDTKATERDSGVSAAAGAAQKRKSSEAPAPGEEQQSPKRPRRAASKVTSYTEPSVGKKLRQGDQGTSSIYQGSDLRGTSRNRDALQTVTNVHYG